MARMDLSFLSLLVFTHTHITYLAEGFPVERMLRAGGLAPDAPRGSLIIKPATKASEKLLVCNAFAHSLSLRMALVRGERDLGLLDYKACRDLRLPLRENDEIDFKDGADTVGSFTISGLPADRAATLLLVVRHKQAVLSKVATFASHAFVPGPEGSAQVAVIDTYLGTNTTGNHIYITYSPGDADNSTLSNHSEELPVNTVVAINPGEYQVVLGRSGGAMNAGSATQLDARSKSSYVVMRVGDKKEELVIFPSSAAHRATGALGGLFVALAAAVHAGLGA